MPGMNRSQIVTHALSHAPVLQRPVRSSSSTRLSVSWASSEAEVREAQALRYQVFAVEMGARLARAGAAPAPMIDWLRLPASNDPIEDYRTWRTRVLPDSFGARRFVELPLTQSDIYR